MRKAVIIVIAIVLVAASIDWFKSCQTVKPVLTRLFKEIDDWQVWEHPH